MRAIHFSCCLAMLAGCSGEVETAKLAGARRTDIPIFEPSIVAKSEAFAYALGEGFDLVDYKGTTWTLSTQRSLAEVLAFYEPRVQIELERATFSEADDADWEDEEEEEEVDEDGAAPDELRNALMDLPSRTFQLESKNNDNVEITVYLQARQRRVWFTILEAAPVGS